MAVVVEKLQWRLEFLLAIRWRGPAMFGIIVHVGWDKNVVRDSFYEY